MTSLFFSSSPITPSSWHNMEKRMFSYPRERNKLADIRLTFTALVSECCPHQPEQVSVLTQDGFSGIFKINNKILDESSKCHWLYEQSAALDPACTLSLRTMLPLASPPHSSDWWSWKSLFVVGIMISEQCYISILLKDSPFSENDVFTQLLNLLYAISVKTISPWLLACQLLLWAIRKGQCKRVKALWVLEI